MISDLLKSDLYELLLQSSSDKKFYFESKDGKTSVLALGPTETVPFKETPSFLKKNNDLLLWSAMNFENVSDSLFYSSYLTLIRKNNETKILINPRINWDINLCFSKNDNQELEKFQTCELIPDFTNWTSMLNEALVRLDLKSLSKVVLKRKKVLSFTNTINPIYVFKTTYQNANDSYKIYVQSSSTQSFISFSPEKLFSLDSVNLIETISLAGSAPRGMNPTEESKLENELTNSEKLIHEQRIVTEEINKRLNTIATDIKTSELSIMKLQYIQHRANHISAKLNHDKNILDIITTLHPTPAVGGTPNEMALSTIADLEQDERKNYAAPIGFATSEYSEWAVGLRSASIDKNTITIFAGCGIVKGSDPKDEWLETENKMRPFSNLFNEATTNG